MFNSNPTEEQPIINPEIELTATVEEAVWAPESVPQLTVDVYRKGNVIYVVSTVAGVAPEDLDVSIDDSILSIKGIRRRPYKENEGEMLINECFWGEFSRELSINENIDPEKIKATLVNGVLVVEIQVIKIVARKIQVNAAQTQSIPAHPTGPMNIGMSQQ